MAIMARPTFSLQQLKIPKRWEIGHTVRREGEVGGAELFTRSHRADYPSLKRDLNILNMGDGWRVNVNLH